MTPAAYQSRVTALPYPPAVAPFLRSDHPDTHWSGILAAVFQRNTLAGYDARRRAAAGALRRLLERSLTDDRALPYLRLLVPTVACARCGREFFRESRRRRFCAERCHREFDAGKRPGDPVRRGRTKGIAGRGRPAWDVERMAG